MAFRSLNDLPGLIKHSVSGARTPYLSASTLKLALTPIRQELPMTTPQARHPQIMALPACTPAERVTWQEIRAYAGRISYLTSRGDGPSFADLKVRLYG